MNNTNFSCNKEKHYKRTCITNAKVYYTNSIAIHIQLKIDLEKIVDAIASIHDAINKLAYDLHKQRNLEPRSISPAKSSSNSSSKSFGKRSKSSSYSSEIDWD